MRGSLKMNHIYVFNVQLLHYFPHCSLTFIGIFSYSSFLDVSNCYGFGFLLVPSRC